MLRLPLALMQAEYHEVRTGGAPDRDCLCDFRTNEAFFIGTTNVDGLWSTAANAAWASIKLLDLERLFKMAVVESTIPSPLNAGNGYNILTTCLHLHDYILPALDRMVALGLFRQASGGARAFTSMVELCNATNTLLQAHPTDVAFVVTQDSWDSLEAHVLGAPASLDWLGSTSLSVVVKPDGNLENYFDLVSNLWPPTGGRTAACAAAVWEVAQPGEPAHLRAHDDQRVLALG